MSHRDGSGFENKLAELFAAKLDLPVSYEWFPMATGFIRNTLRANKCDVVIGYAQGHEMVLNSNHYFTSAYTLVTRVDSPAAGVDQLSDARLKPLKLGVVAGSPPATHMARNGLIAKARPYNLMVDRRHESPIQNMLDDLNMVVFRQGEIIEKLNTQIKETNEKLISQNESQSDQNQTNDEKPPHY